MSCHHKFNGLFRRLFFVCFACSVSVQAATVYKSVDSQGRVSYSDVKPEAQELLVEELELHDYPAVVPAANVAQELQKAGEVADKLRQDRLAREALRIKRLEAENLAGLRAPAPVVHEEHYYPYAINPHRHFRRFPSIHHRPRHRNPDPVVPLRLSNRQRDAGPVIVPKSRLLTP